MTYAARAERYALDVVEGRIIAGRLVRLACQRHLDDLVRQDDPEWPYRFDEDAAESVAGFVELMPHTKGKWASRRELIKLEGWQLFIVCVVFGWLRKSDGLRRFRRVYTEVSRKNAKSTLTAAVGNYMLAADGEHGAEVYSGATSEKQAWEVFKPAKLMAEKTPEFRKFHGVEVNAKSIVVSETASKFEPIIGNPGDGASPTFAITDEYHEHTTSTQYDTMITGMGAREQPLSWVITTAGSDTSGPCYDLRTEVIAVLDGTVENDSLFGVVYTIDEGDDWTSREALQKANPNLGVSVFEDFLLQQQQDAINNPRKQSAFKTKHLNVWVTAASPYFNLEHWNRLGDESLQAEDFAADPCAIGVDLASKLDLAAVVRVFRRVEDDGRPHFYVFPRFYLPSERVMEPGLDHYAGWAAAGHLIATPTYAHTDYDAIEADIKADASSADVQVTYLDPHNATQVITHLQGELGDDRVLEFPQTTMRLSEPMKWVQALIEDGRIHHDGNPVMSWCIGNVTAQEDRNENVFPRKERPQNKIDGAVALIMATAGAMEEPELTEPTIFAVG